MVGDVIGLQLLVRLRRGGRQRALDRRAMIVAAIARRRRDDDRDGVCALREDPLGIRLEPAALGKNLHRREK